MIELQVTRAKKAEAFCKDCNNFTMGQTIITMLFWCKKKPFLKTVQLVKQHRTQIIIIKKN